MKTNNTIDNCIVMSYYTLQSVKIISTLQYVKIIYITLC